MDKSSTPPHTTPHSSGDSPSAPVSDGQAWTEERIRALGAVTDLVTAGQIFGLGRSFTYNLVRTGQFPAPVLRIGNRYRVPVGGILATLVFTSPNDLINAAGRSVDQHDAIRCSDLLHTGQPGQETP
ncbi:hypothetical protein Aca07nite_87130 [Actinoplanes capillaceus]|uniref:DNA-binding protein n=1 Tax=Actinoplanes campanulatus TaxID=113559 RepID=A0ABQ3WZ80_9ACTN|nr:AlpA family transcriptional regulator [Actinoplanes capillaceus]GID51438.1 hypothetical protein Aca07nite_87130 [Actinoplanes capillaceus]